MLGTKVQKGTSIRQDIRYLNYDSYGNIIKQVNYSPSVNITDSFVYDKLQRLTRSTIKDNQSSITTHIDYAFDAVGNFLYKSDYSSKTLNAYQYESNTNRVKLVKLKDGSNRSFGHDNKGNLTHRSGKKEVWYNVINKPTYINRLNSQVNLYYDANWSRYKQKRVVDGKTITTHYIDKMYEIEFEGEITPANAKKTNYISDVAIVSIDKDGERIRFSHKDRLGSTATYTDHNGSATAFRTYDPFGKPKFASGNVLPTTNLPARLSSMDSDMASRRGFTDHEHLDEVELIHMNGRVYDYNLGRFLSVDPFVHGGSQGINPYSYILNNPLAGTDPTGYEPEKVSTVVKVAVAGSRIKRKVTVTAQSNGSDGATVSFSGSDRAAVGAVKSDVTNALSGAGFNVTDFGSQGTIAKIGSGKASENTEVNYSTNAENSDISGSKVGGKKSKKVEADFSIDKIKGHEDGWEDPHEAALAFYKQNEDAYQNTNKDSELTGFLIKADNDNYYFTNAFEVPATFEMRAAIRKPSSWKTMDTLHTHPGGRGNQEGFSKTDVQAVLSGSTPGYYVRTPKGDVRFINKSIAKRTRKRWGARGKSICSGSSSCMTPYGSPN